MRWAFQRKADTSARAPTAAPERRAAGASVGTPRYVRTPWLEPRADREREARVVSEGASRSVTARAAGDTPSPAEQRIATFARGGGPGAPVPEEQRARVERRTGADLDDARVHDDERAHALTRAVGANALTIGSDVYFARGRYNAGSAGGQRLLHHELTHVAQHGGADTGHVDGDLGMSLAVPQGAFDIDMRDSTGAAAGPASGMRGTIDFTPDPHASYSAEIELLQIAHDTDVTAATQPIPGAPLDFSRVGAGQQAALNMTMTTGAGVAPRGWLVDSQVDPAVHPQSSALRPYYRDSWGPHSDEPGWIRSPTDIKPARLWDAPKSSVDLDFDFETVAKGNDNQQTYGSLQWGFHVRSGALSEEYAVASGAASANVQEALDRFRTFFTHEPTVIYFDTDADAPMAGEDTKILEFIPYLTQHSDVQLDITGFADETGPASHNLDLSLRRADSVSGRIAALGVDPNRMAILIGHGRSHAFGGGAAGTGTFAAQPGQPATTAGTQRANRRVEVVFRRTASTPPGP
jgi:outer membrane protein OmpA-like peptidoglycan-associated protein